MSTMQSNPLETDAESVREFDAIIVGAGFAGLYMLYRLRELGLSVRCGRHLVLEPLPGRAL
jgi:cation diffusion facilitator CzcD-associated flavoprotein CzcO